MDTDNQIHSALEHAASELEPDTKAAWARVRARLDRQPGSILHAPGRLGRSVALLVAGLLVVTTAAYAYYRLTLSDPGLESVLESGLATTLDDSQTVSGPPGGIAAETIDGVTAVVDWAYADGSRVAIGFSVSGLDLPDNVDPTLVLNSVNLRDSLGTPYDEGALDWSLEAGSEPGSFQGTYIAYQHLDALPTDSVQLHLEIELGGQSVVVVPSDAAPVDGPAPTEWYTSIAPIGTFAFDFELPVYQPVVVHPDQTVEAAGLAVRLDSLTVNPSMSTALVCFETPAPGDWGLDASLQIGEGPSVPADPTTMTAVRVPDASQPCQDLSFPAPFSGTPTRAVLTVGRILSSPAEYTEASCAAAALNLAQEGTGVDFRCNLGDGRGSIEILAKPEGMNQDTAFGLIDTAFRQVVEGPWVFTVDLH